MSTDSTPQHPVKAFFIRQGKRALKVLAVIAILLCVLGVLTQTSMFRNVLREQIIEATDSALLGRVEIDELDGNLFTGISARGVRVYDDQDKLAVAIKSAQADYSLTSLIDSQLVIETLTLDQPTGLMRYDANGDLNLLQIAKSSDTPEDPSAGAFGIDVQHIKVTSGRLLYINEPSFVPNALTPTQRTQLDDLLSSPDALTGPELLGVMRPLLRRTAGISAPPVPGIALISELELTSAFSLDKQGTLKVNVAPLTSTLDANTWREPLALSSKEIDVSFSPEELVLNTQDISIGQGVATITPVALAISMIPPESDIQTPYPTDIALSVDAITLSRALFDNVAPSLELQDGVALKASASGSPAELTAALGVRAINHPSEVSLDANLTHVLSSLLHDLDVPQSSPKAGSPSYTVSVKTSKLDPSALMKDLPAASLSSTTELTGKGLNPQTDLQADLALKLAPSTFLETWKLNDSSILVSYSDRTLRIKEGLITSPYADADITGVASWPGELELQLKTRTDAQHARRIDIPQVGVLAQKKLDLDVKLSASADLEAEDILTSLTRAALDASWDIEGFEQGQDIALGATQGDLNVSLNETSSSSTRKIALDLNATARDIRAPDVSVGSVRATADSTITTPWPLDDPMALRHALLANVDVQVSNARAAGARVSELDARLELSPASGNMLDYMLNVRTLRGLSYPASKLTLGSLRTKIDGTIKLSSDAEPAYVAARGSGSLASLRFDQERVKKATFELDVAGTPPLLRGDVSLDATELTLGGQALDEADVSADLKDNGDFTLAGAVTTSVSPATEDEPATPSRALKVTARGNISDDLERVTNLNAEIYNPNLSSTEPVWHIEDASIIARGGDITVDQLTLKNGEQYISVQGTYRARGAQDLEVSVRKVNVGQLSEELGIEDTALGDVQGHIERLDLSLQGTARKPVISLDVDVQDFYYQEIGPFDLILKGRYDDDKLTVNTLDLDGYDTDLIRGQARLPIRLDLQGNTTIFWKENVLLTFFVDPINMTELFAKLPGLEDYTIAGTIDGGGILNGTLKTPVLDVNVNAKDLTFEGRVAGETVMINNLSMTNRFEYEPPSGQEGGFRLGSSIKRGDRRIAYVNASSPIPLARWMYDTIERGAEVDYATEVSEQSFAFDAHFDQLRLKELTEMGLTQDLKLLGIFNFDVVGQGTFAEPSIAMDTTVSDLAIQGAAAGQRFDIRELALSSTFTLDGKKGSLDPVVMSTNMSWKQRPVLGLNASMEVPLNGWLTRTSRGEEIDYPKELQTIPFTAKMVVDQFDLSQLAVAPLLKESDAAGVISMNFDAQGTLRDPKADLKFTVGELICESDPTNPKPCRGFGWDRYRDIVMAANIHIKDKLVTLEQFAVNWDDTDIASATGNLPLPMDTLLDGAPLKDINYNFTLDMHPIPLNKLSAVDYTFASLTGALKGKLHLTGSLKAPEASGCFALLDARLGKNRVSAGTIGVELDSRNKSVIGAMKFCKYEGQARTTADYTNICTLERTQQPSCAKGETLAYANVAARLNTDLLALSNGADIMAVSSRAPQGPLKASDDVFVSIHTRENQPLKLEEVLPMNIIKAVATEIQGTLSMDVDIQGTYDAPVPTGNLSLQNAAITIPDLGRRFEQIAIAATMDTDTIDLTQLKVSEGDARINMKGTLNHDKLAPTTVSADLDTKDFNVGAFFDFPFFASGDIQMQGDLAATPMDMVVDVSKLDIQLTEDIGSDLHPTELDGDIFVLSRQEDGTFRVDGEIADANSELNSSEGDIASLLDLKTRVRMSRECWVRHPYGEVNLTGDFTTRIKGASMTMSGEIQALRGQAEFLGKVFRVERALVTFTGADPPDPRLQIEAAYELDQSIVQAVGPASDGQPRIMVVIGGNAYDPVLSLRSDPNMSETDIIYVLATNRPPGTSGVGQDSSVAAAALSAASGLLVGMLKDELSDSLPLDFFDILNVDTSNFEVGKYVYNGKIYLSYRYLFGNIEGNSSIYQFDYHFLPRWTIEAQGSSGESGGELHLNVFWDAF